MRDRVDGVRRAVLRRSSGLGPHAKIPRLESLQAQLGSSPAHSSGLRYWYQLAKSTRSSTMAALARREQLAALARSEHERAARRLPAAALPQRAFSDNTTKRDIPTFVRARIREFEAVLPRPFYLWSVRRASRWRHRLASTATRRSSRIEGVTALVRRRRASASSFWPRVSASSSSSRGDGAPWPYQTSWRLLDGVANERNLTKHTRKSQKQKKNTGREVVAHDARR